MGGSVMFSCRTVLPPDVKSLKKVSLECKTDSEIVVLKTMEHTAYEPRVENISPALPTDDVKDDTVVQVTKDDLLHQITNIDKRITETEAEVKNLGKKLLELKNAAGLSKAGDEEEAVEKTQTPSLAIKVYTDNKQKRHESDTLWEKLGPKIVMPLYNQPSDTVIYHENKRKHLVFKYCLLKFLKCKQAESSLQEDYLITLYMEKKQDWLNKVKAIESSLAHKKKEAEKKIIFEKEFPKLRKQIEEKRKQRLYQIESHFCTGRKGHGACAIVCPIILPSRQQEFRYINNNGLIKDLPAECKEWQLINVWTDAEKTIFKEKFLQHPKQFGIIASYLDQKSIPECIKYYYQSKQTENYKSLLRKTRKRTHMGCNGLPSKRANITQLNSGKVLGVQSSLVAQVRQPSIVDSIISRSSAPMQSTALVSDTVTVQIDSPAVTHVTTEPGNVQFSSSGDEKKLDSTEITFEGSEHQSNKLTSDLVECERERHLVEGERERDLVECEREIQEEETKEESETPTTNTEFKSYDTKTDVHSGIVRSIMLDHSKYLPHSNISQYSVCEEQALHGTQVPSSCNCKFRGSCYTHCQVLMYQNSLNKIQQQHCSTNWNDSHQKQELANIKDGAILSCVSSKSSDVSTVSDSYNVTAPNNSLPVAGLPVATTCESAMSQSTTLQTRVHKMEKPVYGSQIHPVVTKCSEESYRSLVIKTAGRYDENLNHTDSTLHHQHLKLGNGIVKPPTTATEDVPIGEGMGAKQVDSVKDLVMEVIEKQIMKNFGRHGEGSSGSSEGKGTLAPTLSSILQTHHLAGRSQANFVSGFRGGDENRTLSSSQESAVPSSRQPALPTLVSAQKLYVPPTTTYQVLASGSRSSREYLPEGKQTNLLHGHNYHGGVEVGKHFFPSEYAVASHHRLPPLLPTPPLHQKHYPPTSMHQVAVHSAPHSSPLYMPRENVPVHQTRHHQAYIQNNEGTLDLSVKKLRAYNPPGLFPDGFLHRRPFQDQRVQQPPQVSHYPSQTAMPTIQRKLPPQELLPPVSLSSVLLPRNRYASVISQSVIVREHVHNLSGENAILSADHRVSNPSSVSTSVGVHVSAPQVEGMNIYKPYFP